MINMNALALCVTRHEGKKLEVNIAQVKELLGVVADLMVASPGVVECLLTNGRKRAESSLRRRKKK